MARCETVYVEREGVPVLINKADLIGDEEHYTEAELVNLRKAEDEAEAESKDETADAGKTTSKKTTSKKKASKK